jgi:hypothetical protein
MPIKAKSQAQYNEVSKIFDDILQNLKGHCHKFEENCKVTDDIDPPSA